MVARGLSLVISLLLGAATASASTESFSQWLDDLAAEARSLGISERAVEQSLRDVELVSRIVELDRSQPKAPADFCGYLVRRLSDTRIARGKRLLAEHAELLRSVSAEYGVPARFVVALWGLESNFGDYQGDYRVIDALVTLAHDERRGEMFRKQVFAAMRIVDQGHRSPDELKGSWAGAMGQVQFMPTTFLTYAVDYDGDGRKNLWTSLPDSLASAANYLRAEGWRSGETWGREVRLPASLSGSDALTKSHALEEWQRYGVRSIDGGALPAADMRGSIVLPARTPEHAFLVYSNFHTILRWNRSTFFGISVGTLADELSGTASVRACRG